MSRLTARSERFVIGASAALLILCSTLQPSVAQAQPAVVEGTTQLFIRRGPGTDFPPFATLTGGSQVEVQERRGSWARVTTASGQVGYVHTKYLRVLEDEAAKPTATKPTTPQPTVAATSPRPTRPASAPMTPTRRRRAAEAAATPTDPSPTPDTTDTSSPAPTETRPWLPAKPANGNVQREIERLSEAVEALNRRLDQRFPLPDGITTPPGDATAGVSGGAVLLGLVGVFVGWFLGATYQRNKERGRRSRIRL